MEAKIQDASLDNATKIQNISRQIPLKSYTYVSIKSFQLRILGTGEWSDEYPCKYFNDVLPKLCRILIDRYKEFDIEKLNESLGGIFFYHGHGKGTNSKQIEGTDIYVETHFNNDQKMELCYRIIKLFGYSRDDLKINTESQSDEKKELKDAVQVQEVQHREVVNRSGGTKLTDDMKRMEDLLLNKKQIILYGPPGTGKTFKARELAGRFIKGEGYINSDFNELKDKGQIEFITFHPSYGYEEFMERITVPPGEENEQTEGFTLMSGIFKNLCKRALISAIYPENRDDYKPILDKKEVPRGTKISSIKESLINGDIQFTWKQAYDTYIKAKKEDKEEKDVTKGEKDKDKNENIKEEGKKVDFESTQTQKFVLIIDEINRGYISKIFGELITLIEKDKRLEENSELTARLLYSGDIYGVPPNVYIIGTMNTADRSIDLVDIALRRRFGFIEMLPDFNIVENDIKEREENLKSEGIYQPLLSSKDALEKINQRICGDDEIGRDKQIGHSYILQIKTKDELIMAWQHNILPLLDEYCQGDFEKVNQILFEKDNSNWITEKDGIYNFKNDLTKLEEFIKQIK